MYIDRYCVCVDNPLCLVLGRNKTLYRDADSPSDKPLGAQPIVFDSIQCTTYNIGYMLRPP